jgi:streptomycin 6-kinase
MAALPRIVSELAERWSLRVGEPYEPGGDCSWVAAATNSRGEELVLKAGFRHDEALQEADALRAWDGQGVVRLLAAHDSGDAIGLLLECCVPGTPLGQARAEPEQDVIVAGLLRQLWEQPFDTRAFRPLEVMCDEWAARFEQELVRQPEVVDRGLAREGTAAFRELPRTASRRTLLCTDLHAGNILAAGRTPWLVIDPKPYTGDPAYDTVQHMLNCDERLHSDPVRLAERMAALLDLEPARVKRWLFARCVVESIGWRELADIAALLAP